MYVLLVFPEMVRETFDIFCKHSDLDFGGTRVFVVNLVFLYYLRFRFSV